MIKIDLLAEPKFPWGRVLKVVMSICLCSVLGFMVYTSWKPLIVSVERFFETMEDPDNINDPTDNDSLNKTLTVDNLIKKDSSLNDEKNTESFPQQNETLELSISDLDTTLDNVNKGVYADSRKNVLDKTSVKDAGVRKKLKAIGNCYITFDVVEDLSSFVDLNFALATLKAFVVVDFLEYG